MSVYGRSQNLVYNFLNLNDRKTLLTLNILEYEPLKNHTTMHTGGAARYFLKCATLDDIKNGLAFAKTKKLEVLVLGGGSNILISDQGFSGVVLHLETKELSIESDGMVTASAGINWSSLVETCCQKGLSGMEALAGIPGLVGATPIQNVGAYGQEVSHLILNVQALDKVSLKTITFSASECQFGYRQSRFKTSDLDQFIITSVIFQLSPNLRPHPRYDELKVSLEADTRWSKASRLEQITLMKEHVLRLRASKGMLLDPNDPDSRSVGSFFINPVVAQSTKEKIELIVSKENVTRPFVAHPSSNGQWKLSAAWLIENSGIHRGQTLSGARVSTKHVLALTNPGQASTRDILALADLINSSVEKKFGIRLEREPVIIS